MCVVKRGHKAVDDDNEDLFGTLPETQKLVTAFDEAFCVGSLRNFVFPRLPAIDWGKMLVGSDFSQEDAAESAIKKQDLEEAEMQDDTQMTKL